jgi:hypothetical protein
LFNQGLFRHTIFGGAKISVYSLKKKKRVGNLPVEGQKRVGFQKLGVMQAFREALLSFGDAGFVIGAHLRGD